MTITPIADTNSLAAFCEKQKNAAFVTVDTEFVREKTYYPILCLVQVAGPDDAVVIDAMASDIDLSPLDELFKNTNVVKVLHASRQDNEIFFNLFGSVPKPIFDTQIAAMVCGFGDQVAYGTLIAKLVGVQLEKNVEVCRLVPASAYAKTAGLRAFGRDAPSGRLRKARGRTRNFRAGTLARLRDGRSDRPGHVQNGPARSLATHQEPDDEPEVSLGTSRSGRLARSRSTTARHSAKPPASRRLTARYSRSYAKDITGTVTHARHAARLCRGKDGRWPARRH